MVRLTAAGTLERRQFSRSPLGVCGAELSAVTGEPLFPVSPRSGVTSAAKQVHGRADNDPQHGQLAGRRHPWESTRIPSVA